MKLFLSACFAAAVALTVYLVYHPDVETLKKHNPTSTSLMRLRQKQAKETKKPYSARMEWKNLDEISPHLVHAVLLAEDDMFYRHRGFDLQQIRIAIKTNWEKKRYAYGGSTISQQLARTLYLSPKKNILRKLKEAAITYRMEHTLSKHRILELYLNVIEWGRGIYGAEAAARFYYDKAALDLTPDEAVALASILPSPRRWNPLSEKAFMARRRTQLFERMQRAGYVPEDTIAYDEFMMPMSTDTLPAPADEIQGVIPHEAPQQTSE